MHGVLGGRTVGGSSGQSARRHGSKCQERYQFARDSAQAELENIIFIISIAVRPSSQLDQSGVQGILNILVCNMYAHRFPGAGNSVIF